MRLFVPDTQDLKPDRSCSLTSSYALHREAGEIKSGTMSQPIFPKHGPCATPIAQDNQFLHEQTFALQQETARLDREIRKIMQRNEEPEKRRKTNAVAIK
jgi:hypothetical protein